MSDTHQPYGDEISLLDLLVVIAESWKLLILVPLLVGALTFAVTSLTRPTLYQSEAIIMLSVEQSSALQSASLVESIAMSERWLSRHGDSVVASLSALDEALDYQRLPNTRLYVLSFTSESAGAAQGMLSRVLATLLELTAEQDDMALNEDAVLQPPTEPIVIHEQRSPALYSALAILATGFALLIFIFAREGVRRAASDPEGAEKLARIKRAFALRRNRT